MKILLRRHDADRQDVVTLDRRGRRRPAVTLPGHNAGKKPPNYGRKYPAEILTHAEIKRLMLVCGTGPAGIRNRALIVVLWRGGLRCAEALDLELRDINREAGSLLVREGKGRRRRIVGFDPAAFAMLERWLQLRAQLVPPDSKVFCTVVQPNLGRQLSGSYWREAIKRLGVKAGIEKRVHSHGLRHTHAVELMRESMPILHISRQLGHSSLSITQHYVDHLEPGEVVALMQRRAWPLHEAPPIAA
jgi:site-specific recombinase XerD